MNILLQAAEDIRYLLKVGYPRDSAIRYVCDHHRIIKAQRMLLSRVVFDITTVLTRKSKMVDCGAIDGAYVWVDGFNVLFGVECIFLNEPVFVCDDGFFRDLRGGVRNYRLTDTSFQAIDAILSFFSDHNPSRVEFLFDAQISRSGELSAVCGKKLKSFGINGISRTSKRVDFELKQCRDIVATSDGIIIDKVERVSNLVCCIFKKMGKTAKTLDEVP